MFYRGFLFMYITLSGVIYYLTHFSKFFFRFLDFIILFDLEIVLFYLLLLFLYLLTNIHFINLTTLKFRFCGYFLNIQ